MTDRYFRKISPDMLRACDQEALSYLKRVKLGSDIIVKVNNPRNAKYHRKIFALLKFAFENKEFDPVFHRGSPIQVSFEMFRSNMIIWAGFHDVVANIRGEVRYQAHSISYGECDQEKAEQIYSGLLTVIGEKLFQGNYTRERLEVISEGYFSFTT